jgi:recombination protein RecR
MPKVDYPEAVRNLIAHLRTLPGIGPRSAERIAVHLLRQGAQTMTGLAEALSRCAEEVVECGTCGFFSGKAAHCVICDDTHRDRTSLCIVEQATDILPMERSGAYAGQYHVLGGRLAPLDGVGPEDLRIGALLDRLAEGDFREVILALGSDVEGEATGHYLADLLRGRETLHISRLAQGLPAGGGLESADQLTLMRALQGRVGYVGGR